MGESRWLSDAMDIGKMMETFCYDDDKMDLLLKDTGRRIREERLKRNLSLIQLSHLSNVSASHINRIENGTRKVGIEPLLKISRALDVPFTNMLPLEEGPHLMTNGERFERIVENCSVKQINFLLEMADFFAGELNKEE